MYHASVYERQVKGSADKTDVANAANDLELNIFSKSPASQGQEPLRRQGHQCKCSSQADDLLGKTKPNVFGWPCIYSCCLL